MSEPSNANAAGTGGAMLVFLDGGDVGACGTYVDGTSTVCRRGGGGIDLLGGLGTSSGSSGWANSIVDTGSSSWIGTGGGGIDLLGGEDTSYAMLASGFGGDVGGAGIDARSGP